MTSDADVMESEMICDPGLRNEGKADELTSLPHFLFLLFEVQRCVAQNLRVLFVVRIHVNLSQPVYSSFL